MKRPEQALMNLLKEKKLTVSIAESMTCGLAASKLGSVSGTSQAFAGCIVCYSEKVKTNLLNIPRRLIDKYTAESAQVTAALAKQLKRKIDSDVQIAITGLAAEGGSETKQKPVGTVFIAVMLKGKVHLLRKKFNGSPLVVRKKACSQLFMFTLKMVKNHY